MSKKMSNDDYDDIYGIFGGAVKLYDKYEYYKQRTTLFDRHRSKPENPQPTYTPPHISSPDGFIPTSTGTPTKSSKIRDLLDNIWTFIGLFLWLHVLNIFSIFNSLPIIEIYQIKEYEPLQIVIGIVFIYVTDFVVRLCIQIIAYILDGIIWTFKIFISR